MTIHLSKEAERFVHEAVSAGRYATQDDVVNDALNRLKQSIPDEAGVNGKPAKPSAEAKTPMTREAFDRHLLAIGLMSQLPDTAADFDDPDDVPTEIKGEPLSETIIRERR